MALLSAFAEMGLKLRLDVPEQAMEIITVFFRATTSAKESLVSIAICFGIMLFDLSDIFSLVFGRFFLCSFIYGLHLRFFIGNYEIFS